MSGRWLSPWERRRRNNRIRWWAIGLLAGYLLCSLIDKPVFLAMIGRDQSPTDWSRMFRVAGFLPLWLVVAGMFALVDGRSGWAWRRAWPLVVGAAGSGLAAEVLKRLIGRERPIVRGGEYSFKPLFSGLLDDLNLGIPSSHAAVAFGAAFVLARLHPACWPLAIGLAVGCAVQRVGSGAHFLSDVYASVIVAYAVTAWSARRGWWRAEQPF